MGDPIAVWRKFFAGCDLPSRIQATYAATFVKERIQPYMLKELGKEELRSMGVTALGDQLAILRYVKDTNGNPPAFKHLGSAVSSSTSSSQISSTSPAKTVARSGTGATRIVRRGNAITVEDDIPIQRQSHVIQKINKKSPVKLRSEQFVANHNVGPFRHRTVIAAPKPRVVPPERYQRVNHHERIIVEERPRHDIRQRIGFRPMHEERFETFDTRQPRRFYRR